jgi:hypothetical protein
MPLSLITESDKRRDEWVGGAGEKSKVRGREGGGVGDCYKETPWGFCVWCCKPHQALGNGVKAREQRRLPARSGAELLKFALHVQVSRISAAEHVLHCLFLSLSLSRSLARSLSPSLSLSLSLSHFSRACVFCSHCSSRACVSLLLLRRLPVPLPISLPQTKNLSVQLLQGLRLPRPHLFRLFLSPIRFLFSFSVACLLHSPFPFAARLCTFTDPASSSSNKTRSRCCPSSCSSKLLREVLYHGLLPPELRCVQLRDLCKDHRLLCFSCLHCSLKHVLAPRNCCTCMLPSDSVQQGLST